MSDVSDWYSLSEIEREQYLIRSPCTTCKAGPFTFCKMKATQFLSPWHLARQEEAERHWKWNQTHSSPYEPAVRTGIRSLTELYGRKQDKADKALAEEARRRLDVEEATRTCPWCGKLFDTVILMEEHEVECDA